MSEDLIRLAQHNALCDSKILYGWLSHFIDIAKYYLYTSISVRAWYIFILLNVNDQI